MYAATKRDFVSTLKEYFRQDVIIPPKQLYRNNIRESDSYKKTCKKDNSVLFFIYGTFKYGAYVF